MTNYNPEANEYRWITCPCCGKEFVTSSARTIYCSQSCVSTMWSRRWYAKHKDEHNKKRRDKLASDPAVREKNKLDCKARRARKKLGQTA